MLTAIALLLVLPALVTSSGEGNIRLLENEVAAALRSCSYNESAIPTRSDRNNRRSLSTVYNYVLRKQIPRVDIINHDKMSLYGHEKLNSTRLFLVLNGKEHHFPKYGSTNTNVKYKRTTTKQSENAYNLNPSNLTRRKRSVSLISKTDQDQCLSQCVFANLQVVDERGVPREAELWNKVQTALASQQSRIVLRDQVRQCFQELQSEDEDNGCSYSNKLERCLMLRFSDRKLDKKV